MRRGFTLIEGLLVIALMSVISGVGFPLFKNYQNDVDLDAAQDQVIQGVQRAHFLAQSGAGDDDWGYSVENGVVFKGSSYATRDPAFDESYPVPSHIDASGVLEISFAKITGDSSTEGTVLLELGGHSATVHVGTEVGVLQGEDDTFLVCHYPPGGGSSFTLRISENGWPAHEAHGDFVGECPPSSSAGSSSSEGSSSSAGAPPPFTIEPGGGVSVSDSFTPSLAVVGAAITYGGSYDMPVTCKMRIGTNNIEPFGEYGTPVDSNLNDGSSHTYTSSTSFEASDLTVTCKSWVKKKWWYSGGLNTHWKTHLEFESTSTNVIVLEDSDPVPDIEGFQSQESIEDFLEPFIESGAMSLQSNQAIFLFELGETVQNEAYDAQDVVLLLTLDGA